MPKITFLPQEQSVTVASNVKILAAAIKHKIAIRYGCGACRCGTCGVRIVGDLSGLSPMANDERGLLARMNLQTDGSKRLACRSKVIGGTTVVDLDFQSSYSPEEGL